MKRMRSISRDSSALKTPQKPISVEKKGPWSGMLQPSFLPFPCHCSALLLIFKLILLGCWTDAVSSGDSVYNTNKEATEGERTSRILQIVMAVTNKKHFLFFCRRPLAICSKFKVWGYLVILCCVGLDMLESLKVSCAASRQLCGVTTLLSALMPSNQVPALCNLRLFPSTRLFHSRSDGSCTLTAYTVHECYSFPFSDDLQNQQTFTVRVQGQNNGTGVVKIAGASSTAQKTTFTPQLLCIGQWQIPPSINRLSCFAP